MKIYFLGDSNTYGFDPSDYKTGRYPQSSIWTNIVAEELKSQYCFTFDGMNGRCIPSNNWICESIADKIKQNDYFAVMLGTNDYLNMSVPDVNTVAKKMLAFLKRIAKTANYDYSRILLCAPLTVNIPGESEYNTSDGRMSKAFMETAQSLGCSFANTQKWNCELSYDGVHLSENGHMTFAERMIEFLTDFGQKGYQL